MKELSKQKRRWFTVIALITPLVLLLVVELLLRLFSYGYDTRLFIRYPGNPNYWVMNKYASERFFSDTINATNGNIEPFEVQKARNTFRIFVLGESTTVGYPYVHNGSFHRWLQYRLMHTYPNVNFEVVNVALTAVNSYTVLDFGKQILNYQPDAVLIYTGHNEYYGALGIGSTSYIGNNRIIVKMVLELRKLRLVQLINSIVYGIKRRMSTQNIDARENLMKRMAAEQEIPFGSAKYKAGISQFESNMDELCAVMQSRGIPVFLSNLVSNEKDQRPFVSSFKVNLSADAHFNIAVKANFARNFSLAKKEYIKAKELDMLRFRAPEAINQEIEKLSQKYHNVIKVDAHKLFELNSLNQIIGHETLLEHVHPNLYGYALLSDAFYQSIKKFHLVKAKPNREMSFDELLNKMPVTKVDSLKGVYTVMMLESGWPFNKLIPKGFKRGNSVEEQLAGALSVNRISWSEAMNELFQASMKLNDKKTALKAVEAVMLDNPLNVTYKIFAGRLSFELGDDENTLFYFQKAYEQDSSFENMQNMYLACLKTDRPEQSIGYIQAAIKSHPQDVALTQVLNLVEQIIMLKKRLHETPDDKTLKNLIALNYSKLGATEAGLRYK